MGITTKNSRLNKITSEYEQHSSAWSNLVSNISRETEWLKQFAAWRNEKFLTNSGDFDQEDMEVYRATFDEIFANLLSDFSVLQELAEMPASPLEEFKTNNDAFIAKYGIDIEEFDKRFK